MAHEHWHLWQNAMGCPPQNYLQPIWPVWMTEGGAEFMQWQVLVGSGLVANSALATFEQGMIDEATRQGPVTLRSFEAMQYGDRRGYALGYFGTKRLVARAGYGALRLFCGNLAAGATWPAAFTASFGIAPDALYTDFESWRADGYK
jgi:hypothetical protein